MIRDLLVAGLILGSSALQAQLNITLAGRLDYQQLRNSNLSNIWGYTDELGNEYALIGVNGNGTAEPGGISVVDISDPSAPVEVFFFPGPSSIWREIKVWNDHAYVTTEAESGGITIVDLSPLPQSTDLPAILWNAPDWDTSHSLFIDENGRLYLHGADRGNGGVIMYDLTQDPTEPVEVGEFDNWYCHDSYARGDTLYAAHITDGFFSMVDRHKRLHRRFMTELRTAHPEMLEGTIPNSTDIERMGVHREPIGSYGKGSRAARSYESLWSEIQTRL